MGITTALIGFALLATGDTNVKQDTNMQTSPAGYTLGTSQVPTAPITLAELELLKKSLLFTDEDVKYLQMSKEILVPQSEQILDVWYGFVGGNEHLVYFFSNKVDGKPNAEYLNAVRKRFAVWISDTASAKYDQDWLNYQFEIGRRHHRTGKNKTDGAPAVDNISYRYIPALIVPITTTIVPFLRKDTSKSEEDIQKMHAAWVKSVTLQVILWSYPYVSKGDF